MTPFVHVQIDPIGAVGPQIYAILRERIIRNDLHPAARVSESELAGVYGISRQPIREAFIKLGEEGLVEVRPQRGTFITRISKDAVMDARFAREAVEADIVRTLATTRTDGDMATLRAQIEDQRAHVGGNPDGFILLDELFHRTLADACGKGRVWDLVEGFKAQMDRVRYLNLVQHLPTAKLLTQHEEVVAAIGDRDEDGAEAALRRHLRQILDDLPEIAASWPEYFETTVGPPARHKQS